ncbi:MAG TPA: HdeD family acid-resistance protein [Stellaceae bacterium]|nr:HdeD family acid-resistance protein [Stellaceae bacterium]
MATQSHSSSFRYIDADASFGALSARNWWAIALRGVFTILFGLIAILLPGVTLVSLVLLFVAYMLVDGVLAIIAGLRAARRHMRWASLALEGVVDLIAGGIAFFWPLITIVAFVYVMGAWAILSGALLTVAAFRLDFASARWLMVLGGIVSVIWGVLLFAWPLAGALILAWWMGGYALFFGAALLVLAFRLRHHGLAGQSS